MLKTGTQSLQLDGIKMTANYLLVGTQRPVMSLAYNSTRDILAIGQMGSAEDDTILSLWNPSKKTEIQVIESSASKSIFAACFDYRDKFLLYSDNSKFFVFDIDLNQKHVLDTDNEKITKIASAKSTPIIVVSGKNVEIFNIDSGKSIWKLDDYHGGSKTKNFTISNLPEKWGGANLNFINEAATVEIFNDGQTVLIGGHNKGCIEEINISSMTVTNKIFPAPIQSYAMSLGCKETTLAVSSKIPYANFIWNLESGQRLLPDIFNERFGGYSSLCLHPTRRFLASGSLVGFVSVQNLEDGSFVFSEQLHQGRVSQVLFAGDSNKIFSGGEDGDVRFIEFDA